VETSVARANIDHYIGILNSDILLSSEKRQVIIKLLLAEMDRLSHDREQLRFAESKVASGLKRLQHVRRLRDGAQPANRANAERLVANVEATQQLLKKFCQRLKAKVKSLP
jgi:hypothetical protein